MIKSNSQKEFFISKLRGQEYAYNDVGDFMSIDKTIVNIHLK